jgi:small-conductance mechanosensitive channel
VTENERRAGWELHRRDALGEALTDTERVQLDAYRKAVEEKEAVYLRPANQRIERRLQYLEQRNTELAALVAREEALVQHLEATLRAAEGERRAIADEYKRLQRAPEPVF